MPASLLYLVLILFSTALAFSSSTSPTAVCYAQGSLATVSVNLLMTTEYAELPVLGNLLAIVNVSRGAYVSYQGKYLEVLSLNIPANITITYLTELFEYVNGEYVAEFYNPYKVLTLYLPLNAVVTEISNLTHLRKTDDRYELVFSEGYVRLVYIFVETKADRAEGVSWVWMAVGAGLVSSGGFLVYTLYVKRRRESEELEALDERDRAIINALKSGPMTPQELVKVADMSKATFYRRIKRLMSMGYIEQVKKEGKVYYRIKRN